MQRFQLAVGGENKTGQVQLSRLDLLVAVLGQVPGINANMTQFLSYGIEPKVAGTELKPAR